MTAATALGRAPARPLVGRAVVGLMAVAVFINYVDRGALATAAPLIKGEMRLSASQIGLLLSAFFWVYTPAQLLIGWVAERINPYRTLALGLAIWGVATMVSALAAGFAALMALRLLLGLGESAAFPCSSKILGARLPTDKLGLANGLIAVGLALGPAFGTFAGGLIMAAAGWRVAFFVFGLGSLVWLLPWLFASARVEKGVEHRMAAEVPSFLTLLGRRAMWGAGAGHFSANYVFYFVIFWLPLYLVKAHGLGMAQMARLGGLIYLVYAASSLLTGLVCDRLVKRGVSPNAVYKSVIVASHVISATAMAVSALGRGEIAIAGLFLAGLAFGWGTPAVYAIGQTLAGPKVAGKWVSLQNFLGNLAGLIAPALTGLIVDKLGGFTWAFVVAGLAALAGAAAWGLVIHKIAPLEWSHRPLPSRALA
ncbi:MAG TPA: MFS transporter [Caulobacteraceae bacterium]|nr:MFS transporter [Caulobacteraceae bacterium]